MTCSCNCSPCNCPASGGEGCLPDACLPRACFFNGQLINADDLNAAANYSRAKDLLFGRFVAGWGIYGGLVVRAAPGLAFTPLGSQPQVGPNPQVIAGTTVEVSAGIAIDSRGRTLTLCAPATIDLIALANENPVAPVTKMCSEWFSVPVSGCSGQTPPITARAYYLVAEYIEVPARPAPQFSGGGACDPSPTCEFSRKIEGVRFALVPDPLPPNYHFDGCLESIPNIPPIPDFGDNLMASVPPFLDALNEALSASCCGRPIVALARVLLTASTSGLGGQLPQVPVYTVLDNRYENRRVTPSSALHWEGTLYFTSRRPGPLAVGQVLVAPQNPPDPPISSYVTQRGFQGSPERLALGQYACLLEAALLESRRVVNVTPRFAPNGPTPLVVMPSIEPSGSDFKVRIDFYDANGDLKDPAGFDVTVHGVGQ